MPFNSFDFFVFLPLVFIFYYLVPGRFRNVLLLIASLVFYSFFGLKFFLIVLAAVILNYHLGILLSYREGRNRIKKSIGLTRLHWLDNLINIFTTFILVCLTWIFFRSNSMAQAWQICKSVVHAWPSFDHDYFGKYILNIGLQPSSLLILAFALCLLIATDLLSGKRDILQLVSGIHPVIRYTLYYIFILLIVLFGIFQESSKFLYFSF